ncbi:interferon lambda-1 isoform X1 [Rhinolophus sinicus]|uniref:interferon lambda-1 isoform X1 n=1 Tax=Rhinolophus sinicus TaxID=89399 RepID=UPI003D7A0A29
MLATWFLVLVALELGLARAGPVPISTSTRTGCDIGKFKSLLPTEWKAFKKAKDTLENSLKPQSCCFSLFPRNWELTQLQVWERPVALEAELALTLKVLETMPDLSLGDILDQPLHTLHHIHSELQACILPQPATDSRPHGLLYHWLHRLQKAPKKVSQECLQCTVTFNLFRLLTRDLNCVAKGDLCV